MKDEQKTKAELIDELKELRRQIGQKKINSTEINKNPVSNNYEEFNRAVVENSPLGISVRSAKGKLLSVNNAWKKIWSFSDEQVKELMKADPVDPSFLNNRESLGEWLPKVENIYKNGGFLHIPKLFLTDKQCDRSCWVSLTYYAINDDKGDVDRIVILTDDITERVKLEQGVLESQSKYRSVIDNANIGVLVIQDNQIVFSNSYIREMLEYSEEEYNNIDFISIIHPDDRAIAIERVKTRLSVVNNNLKPLEIRAICKSGKIKWIEANSTLIQWENKPALQSFVSDITESKLAENTLNMQKQRLDYILQGTNVGTWEWNIQTGETTFNERWANIIGYTLDELAPVSIDTWMKFAHPDDLKLSGELLEKHFKGELNYYECEARMRHKNGDWVWVLDRGKIATWTEDGKPLIMCGTHTDITKRKLTEVTLKKNEEKLRNIFEHSNNLFYSHTPDNILTYLSPQVEKLLGYTPEEAMVRWTELASDNPINDKGFQKTVATIETGRAQPPYELELVHKNGTKVMVEIREAPIVKNGKTIAIVGAALDITERKQAEEDLQRYECIVASSNDMLALLDKNFVYLAVNERYAKAFGMTRGELVGSTVSKIFGKELFESVIQPYAEKCMQGHEIRYQDWFDFPANGKRYMEITYDPYRGHNNKIKGFVVNGRDITDRKQAEEALRESEEHYKNFFDNALVGFFRTKISDGTFVEINSKAAEQLGLPIEKIVGKMRSVDLYQNADQRKKLLSILKRDGVVHDFETDLTLHDGRDVTFSISLKAYPDQDYLEGITVDITERKRAEQELGKLAEVVKYSSELVNMADLDGNMIFLNEAGGDMLGVDPDNVQNTNIMEVIPEKWKNIVQNELLPALMSSEHWEGKLQYRNVKTGKLTDVHAMAFTVKDPKTGKPQFLANVSLDITETKRLQEQESRAQRLESAGRVAGQIAHDFNNLLAPLVAYPDFIKEGLPDNHPTLKYINDMEKSANQIAEINQQLLTLSRRGHYNQEILNLNEVIQFAIGEMGILPQTVVIETDFARNLMNIKGGASQINRILFNLIHNARDAMQDVGNISIKTENYYVDNPTTNFGHIPKGEYVKVTISDIGCGIPENIKLNIFDPFYTTKSSDKKRGSGLGLSVVDAVMKDHDGFIDLQSSVGEGTAFYLYFPITRETVDATCEEEITGGTESILVVDDDKSQCDVALKLLKKLGYSATALNSGEQAIKYLKKNPQYLLLLDMIMPDGIDGTETFRQVIEMYPNQKAIIVSGYAESSRVEEARQLGIEMYIRKPLTIKLLASCIRKVLDKEEIPVNAV